MTITTNVIANSNGVSPLFYFVVRISLMPQILGRASFFNHHIGTLLLPSECR